MPIPSCWEILTEQPVSVGAEGWRRIRVAQTVMNVGVRKSGEVRCHQCLNITERQRRGYPCVHIPYTGGNLQSARTWKCVCCLLRGQTCEFQTSAELLAEVMADQPLSPISWYSEVDEVDDGDDWRDFINQEEALNDVRDGGLYLPGETVYQRWEDVPAPREPTPAAQEAPPNYGVEGRISSVDEPPSYYEEVEAAEWLAVFAAGGVAEPSELAATEVFELGGRPVEDKIRKRDVEEDAEEVAGPSRRRRLRILDSEDSEVEEEIPWDQQRAEGKRRMDRWLEDKVREFGEQLQTLQCLYEEISEVFVL